MLEPPILGESTETGLPLLVIAMIREQSATFFVTVDGGGKVATIPETGFTTDWRWSLSKGWHDATLEPDV
jgi:hypothetical protein